MSTPQTHQIVHEALLPVTRTTAREQVKDILTGFDTDLDQPLRLRAANPSSSILIINASQILTADGGARVAAAYSGTVAAAYPQTTIDFQTGTIVGGTVTTNGGTFTLPTGSTIGKYRRVAFVFNPLLNAVDTTFSAEQATVGALSQAGILLAALTGNPLGYMDIQATSANAFKTANSATSIIENQVSGTATIVRFGAGSGGSASGGTSSILTTLKDEFVDSPYGFLTPNIIATSGQALISSLTGATYDLATSTIKYTANAQVSVSTNLVDVTEYLSQSLDIGSLDLSVFWNLGTTIQTFSVPSAFTYEVSRDGGTNYYAMTMSQVGTTNTFRGNVVFGTSTTTEVTFTNLASVAAGTQSNTDLNITTQQQLSQSFTVPANQNWVLPSLTLNVVKTGSPTGFLYVSVIRNTTTSSTLPSTAGVDLLAQSTAINIAGVTTGALAVTLPSVVLAGGSAGANYSVVVSSDAGYKAVFAGGTKLQFVQNTSAALESIYNGSSWSSAGTFSFVYTLAGRQTDLRVRITSAGSPTYPCGLDGYGLFYSLTSSGLVGQSKKTQRFSFNSVTDNLSTFTLNFTPDPDLLTCYWVEGGQAFKVPAFSLAGLVATFPASTFNQAGVSQTITLIFDQNSGGASDSAPANTTLLAFNHLGSTGGEDKSVSGRGIILRNAAGILREIALDANDNIIIMTVP